MAVSSDDWPRYSFLTGDARSHATFENDTPSNQLWDIMSAAFTLEFWLQLRAPKQRNEGARSWVAHSLGWACGVDASGEIIVCQQNGWYTTKSSQSAGGGAASMPTLTNRRWTHVAVVCGCEQAPVQLFVNGSVVSVHEYTESSTDIIDSRKPGFCIGFVPKGSIGVPILLHEMRLWNHALEEEIIASWSAKQSATNHPAASKLAARWAFTSGTYGRTELDLSGNGRNLLLQREQAIPEASWVRVSPPSLAVSSGSFIIKTLQSSTEASDECRFTIDIKSRINNFPASSPESHVIRPAVVFIINVLRFKSTSVTNEGEGSWLIDLLTECIRDLPDNYLVGFQIPGAFHENESPLSLLPMTSIGKTQAMKVLDQLHMNIFADWQDLLVSIENAISALHPRMKNDDDVSVLSFSNVIVINGASVKEEGSFKQALSQLEATNGLCQQQMNIYLLHLTSMERLISITTRLYVEYVDCLNDFEWVLSNVLKRIQSIRCKNASLKFEPIGQSEIKIDQEPFVCPSVSPADLSPILVSYGLCDKSQVVCLSGTFKRSPSTSQSDERMAFVEVTFVYFASNKRLCEERIALCLREDLRNEVHIERVKRNKELALREDNALLLEQRRCLMSEKASFQLAFAYRNVAEAENAFKKTDIMKEELWAKRTWIVERGLRLFEENELKQLEHESIEIDVKFRKRLEFLQAQYAINLREGSRGHADNGTHRVHQPNSIQEKTDVGDSDESLESVKLRHQKLMFKADLWTTQLVDLESKMFDMHGSVRAAQSKGFVIMNDARRSWLAKYNDMMDAKRQLLLTLRTKAQLEQRMVILELKQQRAQETTDNITAMNRLLTRYEKEHIKRKKRIFLSMKELIACTQTEFEASTMLEKMKRDIRQCKLMSCSSLPPEVYSSCVHIFFPVHISDQESNCLTSMELNNTMHCVLFGLRHYCRTDSQIPYCRRLSHNDGFLWTDQEQRDLEKPSDEYLSNKKRIQQECWATVIVTYNSLFASPTAAQELRELLCGLQSTQNVTHFEMEAPFENLEEFRHDWVHRQSLSRSSGSNLSRSVEMEYFRWKQNLSNFETVMRSTDTQTLRLQRCKVTCLTCQHRRQDGVSRLLPCLDCCRPYVSRSAHQISSTCSTSMPMGIFEVVHVIGAWLDGIPSSSIKSTVRSHLLDPKAISPFSSAWQQYLSAQVAEQRARWEEKFTARKREMNKQIQKIFKVYEEEANEIMNLEYAFEFMKRDNCAGTMDRLKIFRYEQDLIRIAMMPPKGEIRDHQVHHQDEMACMLQEEIRYALIDPEIRIIELEAVEESEDQREQEILAAKKVYHEALKRSNHIIAKFGAQFVDHKLQEENDFHKFQDQQDQIEHIESLYRFEEEELTQFKHACDDAIKITRTFASTQEQCTFEDARSFLDVSRLEMWIFSRTTIDTDLILLQKLSRDAQNQNLFKVSVLQDTLITHLMTETTKSMTSKVDEAIQSFVDYYSPSPKWNVEKAMQAKLPAKVSKIKEFCAFNADNPVGTWLSLTEMTSSLDREMHCVRKANKWLSTLKLNFQNEFAQRHLNEFWLFSKELLHHLAAQLQRTKSLKDVGFKCRDHAELQFQLTIEEREQCKHHMLLHNMKLAEMKDRNNFLLKILKKCRASFDKSSQMNDALNDFKMDILYKNWSSIGEFHITCVGDLYDLRARCAADIEILEQQITGLERQLNILDLRAEEKQQIWMKEIIEDTMLCESADKLQELVHQAIEQVIQAEERRVFHLFSAFDLRHEWIKEGGMNVSMSIQPGTTDRSDHVDQNLIQLSIARLDTIKQAKLRDNLARKLRILERMKRQEAEKLQMIIDESRTYQELDKVLIRRVKFVVEKSSESRQLNRRGQERHQNLTDENVRTNKILPSLSFVLSSCQDELDTLAVTTNRDRLQADARVCQLSWRMQEQMATRFRVDFLIKGVTTYLETAEEYIKTLQHVDKLLYLQGLANKQNERENIDYLDPDPLQGVDLSLVLLVFDYYGRLQWSKQSLSMTTSINERIQHLKEKIGSLSADDSDEDLHKKLDQAHGEQLMNWFECRTAEQMVDEARGNIELHLSKAKQQLFPNDPASRYESVALSQEQLACWLFSWELCHKQKQEIELLLHQIATTADARDVAGNLVEVIYGASLDSVEIKQMYMVKSKAYVEEQWNIVLVVFFFARLFRQAALRKAANLLKQEAAERTQRRLQDAHNVFNLAQALRAPNPWLALIDANPQNRHHHQTDREESVKNLIRHLQLQVHESGNSRILQRISDGLLTSRPLHLFLTPFFPGKKDRAILVQLMQVRAQSKRQPPPLFGLELVEVDQNRIKITWQRCPRDHDLVYIVQVLEWNDHMKMHESALHWETACCRETGAHTIYNLRSQRAYCIRVSTGFTPTRPGNPCPPLFITTL